jgi:hypothetical protein
VTKAAPLLRYLSRSSAPEPPERPERRNPYPGARPFAASESEWFHGRRSEVAALAALVRAQRFCLLYAPSGAGKSSLISAGLLARVDCHGSGEGGDGAGDFDVIGTAKVHPSAVRRPDGRWPDKSEVSNVYVTAALNSVRTDERSRFTTLAELFESRAQVRDRFGDPVPRLLILDQFEEVLEPFARDDWLECRDDLFRQLDGVLVDDQAAHVLVAIREDHLATIERLTASMRIPFQARYRLDKLTEQAAKQAIEKPAQASGLPVEPDVSKRLIAELARRRIDELERQIPDEFIEPGQLQVVCNRLWVRADEDPENRRTDREPAMRMKHVDDAGGVEGSLQVYYEDAVTAIATGRELRALRWFMEHQLVSPRSTRQLVPFEPGATTGKVRNKHLERLKDEYGLVRRERRGGTEYWELSHDGFIDPIKRANLLAWDHRRRRRNKWIFSAIGVAGFVVSVWAVVTSLGAASGSTALNDTRALQQYPISRETPLPTAVPLGRFDGGSRVVVELVQPVRGTATQSLHLLEGPALAPSRPGPPFEYTIPQEGEYVVEVDGGAGASRTPMGINVRPGATIVELPAVVGTNVTDAARSLTDAKPAVVSTRSVCSNLPQLQLGETLRIIDVDRTLVRGVDGVLVQQTANGVEPSGPVYVATGTSLTVEAFDGTRCEPPTSDPPGG